jgi:hypothetical protein
VAARIKTVILPQSNYLLRRPIAGARGICGLQVAGRSTQPHGSRRCDLQLREVPASIQEFVLRHEGSARVR